MNGIFRATGDRAQKKRCLGKDWVFLGITQVLMVDGHVDIKAILMKSWAELRSKALGGKENTLFIT